MNEPATDSAHDSEHDSAPNPAPEAVAAARCTTTGTAAWLVYLLECADGSLYCGVTTNLDRRLGQHNGLTPGGARYTRGRRPVRLVASRTCDSKSQALRLEKAVKSQARTHKLQFLLSGDMV